MGWNWESWRPACCSGRLGGKVCLYKLKDRVEVTRNEIKELCRGVGVEMWPVLW